MNSKLVTGGPKPPMKKNPKRVPAVFALIAAALFATFMIYKSFIKQKRVFMLNEIQTSNIPSGKIDTPLKAAIAISHSGVEKEIPFKDYTQNEWFILVDFIKGEDGVNLWKVTYIPNFATLACTYFISEEGVRQSKNEGCQHNK
jgi:hypothetical protein